MEMFISYGGEARNFSVYGDVREVREAGIAELRERRSGMLWLVDKMYVKVMKHVKSRDDTFFLPFHSLCRCLTQRLSRFPD